MALSSTLVWLGFVVIAVRTGDTSAYVYEIEEQLQDRLFSNYSKHVRPSENGEPVVLDFGFYLLMLLDVDEKLQIIKTRGLEDQMWTDCRLKWDPAEYGGMRRTIVPTDWLWTPKVVNYRSANERHYLSETKTAAVYYNGMIRNIPQDVLESPCTLDVRYFPFDTQQCTLSFAPWNYLSHEMLIRAYPDTVGFDFLPENSEWEIVGSSSQSFYSYSVLDDSNWTSVDFILHLKRKPLYYIVNIITPSIAQALLTLFVFFLPCDAGEKLSFSVSILIATSLFSIIVLDITPVTSQSIPLIMHLLYFNTLIITLSIAISIVALGVHYRPHNEIAMNKTVRRVFLEILPPILGLKALHPKMNSTVPSGSGRKDDDLVLENIEDDGRFVKPKTTEKMDSGKNDPFLTSIAKDVQDMRDIMRNGSMNKESVHAWKYLSVVVDRFCFFILLIVYVVGVVAIFLQL
ncbi:neuronal acetylcholine receptor subunit alpha-6-like [Ptychodera flava]|uniref:neuronal acetylcholine receptor subunit alpha-6-like n=1 Tax=Ptychodera flava TaxID=63121 RepID=UPI003969CF11